MPNFAMEIAHSATLSRILRRLRKNGREYCIPMAQPTSVRMFDSHFIMLKQITFTIKPFKYKCE